MALEPKDNPCKKCNVCTNEQTDLDNVIFKEPEGFWNVIGLDDNVTPFELVLLTVQKACGYGFEKAYEITNTIHTQGQAIIITCEYTKAEKVLSQLRTIKLGCLMEKAI